MTLSPKGAEAAYTEALQAGRFLIQKCATCARHVFYPRESCTHCRSFDLQWVEPSGLGTVYSTSVVRRKPEHGGDLNVAIVELDEGVRMMSRVEGLAPDLVRIGMRVSAGVVDGKAGKLVVFRISEAAV